MTIQVKRLFIIITIVTTLAVDCIPLSPCPMNFHYEFDGQEWIGIAKIYPQIYNRFRTDRITMNLWLVINQHMPNLQNLNLLQLKKSLQATYEDIAKRRPIQYRISFPFRNNFPELLLIQVNGVQLCRNSQIFYIPARIELKYTFFLPTVESEEEQLDEYGANMSFQFNPNAPEPAITNSMIEVPNVAERIDEEDGQQKKHPRWQKRLLATNSQCGTYDEDLKYTQLISGGNKIMPGTWPWLVAIFVKESRASNLVFQCTGNLISNRLVLTAAHCFKSDSKLEPVAARKVVLAFGRHDIRDWTEKNMVISDVDEIIVHPDYLSKKDSKIFDADIAILITKDFISYTSMIKPICLWPSSVDGTHSLIGTNGTLVGWGQPFENVDENVPRRLTLPIVRNNLCFPSDRSTNARRVFCAGTEKRGYAPCNGDSGSALAIYANGAWFLRGLVSAALGDPILNRCDLNTYAIFTDIINYRTWIDSHM
ncbi:serine protease gd-like [Sitodiplosis mosellana]|uniref:serine protease gd-like n=1 Tax=Sitodiplosis mosellana TaxID=263140 RepID=UPI002444BEB7|nr:serine protease gd-like [Sitodiplosis mosellana]